MVSGPPLTGWRLSADLFINSSPGKPHHRWNKWQQSLNYTSGCLSLSLDHHQTPSTSSPSFTSYTSSEDDGKSECFPRIRFPFGLQNCAVRLSQDCVRLSQHIFKLTLNQMFSSLFKGGVCWNYQFPLCFSLMLISKTTFQFYYQIRIISST